MPQNLTTTEPDCVRCRRPIPASAPALIVGVTSDGDLPAWTEAHPFRRFALCRPCGEALSAWLTATPDVPHVNSLGKTRNPAAPDERL